MVPQSMENMGTEVMGHLGSSKWRMKATVIQAKSVNEQSSDSAVKVSFEAAGVPGRMALTSDGWSFEDQQKHSPNTSATSTKITHIS
mmetsp:Transcript_35586/g.73090  ORF Transcript_35586/g.73090 Transcript_35586/m.73090 type:complete len:87 (-) Transcript_35586:116-376(-)